MRGRAPVRQGMSGRRDTANGRVDEAAKAEKKQTGEVANATSASGGL